MRGRAVALLLVSLGMISCAKASAKESQPKSLLSLLPGGFQPWPDWTNPLGKGAVEVADLSQAESLIHFSPTAPPETWGAPSLIQAASPDSTGQKDSVAWMYLGDKDQPLYLLIESSPPEQDQKSLEDSATCGVDEVGCIQENFALVTLGDGSHALLVNGLKARLVDWIQGDVEFIIAGPLDSFDEATAVKMADEIR